MGDYHEKKKKKDVLLLADVFEKFISTCIKHELDPQKKYLTLTGIYLLKKEQGEEFLTLLKDMLKQITNT